MFNFAGKSAALILLLFSMLNLPAQAQNKAGKPEVNWLTFAQLQEKMKEHPRKVLIDVSTHWCGPCKMMMANTFHDSAIVSYINKNFYAVSFDAESPDSVVFLGHTFKNPGYQPGRVKNTPHQLTEALAAVKGKIMYPTVVYMDEQFRIISPVQGYILPKDEMPILTYIANDKFKTESFQDYLQQQKSATHMGAPK